MEPVSLLMFFVPPRWYSTLLRLEYLKHKMHVYFCNAIQIDEKRGKTKVRPNTLWTQTRTENNYISIESDSRTKQFNIPDTASNSIRASCIMSGHSPGHGPR